MWGDATRTCVAPLASQAREATQRLPVVPQRSAVTAPLLRRAYPGAPDRRIPLLREQSPEGSLRPAGRGRSPPRMPVDSMNRVSALALCNTTTANWIIALPDCVVALPHCVTMKANCVIAHACAVNKFRWAVTKSQGAVNAHWSSVTQSPWAVTQLGNSMAQLAWAVTSHANSASQSPWAVTQFAWALNAPS